MNATVVGKSVLKDFSRTIWEVRQSQLLRLCPTGELDWRGKSWGGIACLLVLDSFIVYLDKV